MVLPVQAFNRSLGMDVLGFEKELSVKAPHSSLTLSFPVPRLARIRSASATFALTPGPQLHEEAAFSFYLNDKLLETKTVKEIRLRKKFTINLPLAGEFRDTINLQIKSNMFISNDLCRDYYTGGLFFTVNPDTKVDLNYDMLPVRSVADFFGNFQQSLLIIVPASAGLSEMMPAAWTYGVLKKNYPHMDIQIVKANDLGNRPATTPRIWVAVRNQLPAYFNKTQPGIALADPNTLVLSAGSASELESVARQLADLPVFPNNPNVSRKIEVNTVANSAGNVTEGLSFSNQDVQTGVLQVSSDFLLYPALLGNVPEKMGLHLEGSNMVSFEQVRPARLDVFFNSNLVHSSVLDQSGRFSRDIVLPGGMELLTRNNLNVQVNYPEEPGQCQVRGKTQSAQILPNSYLWGAGQRKMDHFTWSNIGMFFGRQGIVLVDEKLDENPLKLIADLVMFLNRQLPSATYAFPAVQTLSDQSFLPPDQYVVALVKSGNEPPFLQELMPMAQGQSITGNRENNSGIPLEFQTNVTSVVGKITENNGVPVIVFSTKQNGKILAEAFRYLNHPGHYAGLVGNIMAFRQPGLVYSLDVRDNDKSVVIGQTAAQGLLTRFWNQYKPEIVIVGAALAVIFLLLLLFGYIRKRREDQNSYYGSPIVEQEPVGAIKTQGRGRPRKNIAVMTEPVVEPETIIVEAPVEAASVESAKRRGRPKKNIAVMSEPVVEPETIIVEVPVEAAPVEVPKRRGRPKKNTSEPRPDEENATVEKSVAQDAIAVERKAAEAKPPANDGQTAKKNLFASGTR